MEPTGKKSVFEIHSIVTSARLWEEAFSLSACHNSIHCRWKHLFGSLGGQARAPGHCWSRESGSELTEVARGALRHHQLFLRQRRQLSNVWLAQGCRSKRSESSSPRTVYCTETSVWDRLRVGEKAPGLGIHFCCSIAPCSPVNR